MSDQLAENGPPDDEPDGTGSKKKGKKQAMIYTTDPPYSAYRRGKMLLCRTLLDGPPS